MQRTGPVPRIGLTGGIGSGKSTLARLLEARGAGLIDSDALSREITAAGGAAIGPIRERFGASFIAADGALDRVRMREHVFASTARRRELESLLHPLIRDAGERKAAALEKSAPYLLYDIPLLAETLDASGPQDRFDRVLVVDCPAALQVERVVRRGSMDRTEVLAVMAAQAGRGQRLAIADDIAFNGGTLDDLERGAGRLHARYAALRDAAASL